MTDEEKQAAASAVEAALYGWIEPSAEDQVALGDDAKLHDTMSALREGQLIAAGESDDYVGKPTLSGE